MPPPRYKARSHYRTRRSSSERIAICPSLDLGATALDRPIVQAYVPAPRVPRYGAPAPGDPHRDLVRLGLSFVCTCAIGGVAFGLLLALALP